MRNNVLSIWTEGRIERLKALWESGSTASEIAAEFSTTRNSVLGKIHRLGLSVPKVIVSIKRKIAGREVSARQSREIRVDRPPRKFEAAQKASLQCVEIEPRNITLLDLEPSHCRFPYGEGNEITFCGHPKLNGSYCGPHAWLTTNRASWSRAEGEVHRRESRLKHKQSILNDTVMQAAE